MAGRTEGRVHTDAVAVVLTEGALAAFVQDVELSVVSLYARASAVLGSPSATSATASFVAHHRAHARAFAQLAGLDAVNAPSAAIIGALQPVAPLESEHDGLAFLYALESRLAATHQYMVGRFTTTPLVSLSAGTLPVECQHTVILGTLLSLPLGQLVATAQGDDGHLIPEQSLRP